MRFHRVQARDNTPHLLEDSVICKFEHVSIVMVAAKAGHKEKEVVVVVKGKEYDDKILRPVVTANNRGRKRRRLQCDLNGQVTSFL